MNGYFGGIILCLSTDVYLSLNGRIIPNHGYVNISDIGSNDPTALLCNTYNAPTNIHGDSGGNWNAPDGTAVGRIGNNNVPGFVRNRSPMVVRLKRTGSETPNEGIYHCDVMDNTNTEQNVYVGLYNDGGDYFSFIRCV